MELNKTTILSILAVAAMTIGLGITPVVQAIPADQAGDTAKDVTEFVVPEHAKEIAPGVFSLGTTTHNGKLVEGILAFHHRTGHDGGPPGSGGGGDDGDTSSTCFSIFTNGAKWRTEEPWNIDTSTAPASLSSDFLKTDMAENMDTWEVSDGTTNFAIFGDIDENIDVDGPDTSSPDDKNEVIFADISSEGAIAVTVTWYERTGPPQFRDIIEWDQVYDDVDFAWAEDATDEPGEQMDFANIATHELGHALGLGHPGDECTEETMYAFAGFDEEKKRTLHDGDIAGVKEMYS